MTLRLLEAPAVTPVSLVEAKAHLRVDHTDDDTQITSLLSAAVSHLDGAAGILGRCLVTQEWALDLDAFQDRMAIPLAPVQSVDAVKYLDASGVEQTVDSAVYVLKHGAVYLASGQSWPVPLEQAGSVRIEFTAGYGLAANVPAALKSAILLLVGHWYANREAVNVGNIVSELPMAVQALTTPFIYRVAP